MQRAVMDKIACRNRWAVQAKRCKLRRNQKEMLDIKNTAEIKCLYQIIKQDIAKKGIAELKEFSIETAKTERKTPKTQKLRQLQKV